MNFTMTYTDIRVRRIAQIHNLVRRSPFLSRQDVERADKMCGCDMWDAPIAVLDSVYHKLRKRRKQERGCAV